MLTIPEEVPSAGRGRTSHYDPLFGSRPAKMAALGETKTRKTRRGRQRNRMVTTSSKNEPAKDLLRRDSTKKEMSERGARKEPIGESLPTPKRRQESRQTNAKRKSKKSGKTMSGGRKKKLKNSGTRTRGEEGVEKGQTGKKPGGGGAGGSKGLKKKRAEKGVRKQIIGRERPTKHNPKGGSRVTRLQETQKENPNYFSPAHKGNERNNSKIYEKNSK